MAHPDYAHIGKVTIRLIEECSELIKILCKVERFGWHKSNPLTIPEIPNIAIVELEIEDVLTIIEEIKEIIELEYLR